MQVCRHEDDIGRRSGGVPSCPNICQYWKWPTGAPSGAVYSGDYAAPPLMTIKGTLHAQRVANNMMHMTQALLTGLCMHCMRCYTSVVRNLKAGCHALQADGGLKSFAVNLNPAYSITLNTTTQTTTGQYFLATIVGTPSPPAPIMSPCQPCHGASAHCHSSSFAPSSASIRAWCTMEHRARSGQCSVWPEGACVRTVTG